MLVAGLEAGLEAGPEMSKGADSVGSMSKHIKSRYCVAGEHAVW